MQMEPAAFLPANPAERITRLRALMSQMQAGGGFDSSGIALLQQLIHQLPPADPALFAAVDDSPAGPTSPETLRLAASWAAATSLQMQLAAGLVQQLGAAELGLQALVEEATADMAADGRVAPPLNGGSAGQHPSFMIEELDTEEVLPGGPMPPSPDLPAAAVLGAALYCTDARLVRPWAAVPVLAAAAAQLLAALASKLLDVAPHGITDAPLHSLVTDAPSEPLVQGVDAGQSQQQQQNSGQQQQQQQQQRQPEQVQWLLLLALPRALRTLLPVLAARAQHEQNKTARLEPYTGPRNFERCVAAGQLAWLLRQLSGRQLSAAIPHAVHAVLTAVEDPFPPTQACGLWALQHVAAEGLAADLRPHTAPLLRAIKGALAGGADASWPAAAAAAIALAACLEGSNPYSLVFHDVMSALLDHGELGGLHPDRAAVWLSSAAPLFPHLGLQLASHSARLMPLLLGWCLAAQPGVKARALCTLGEVLALTWPRAGVHAALTWRVLRRAHEEERLRGRAAASAAHSMPGGTADVSVLAEDVAVALWCAAGPDFQVQLMSGKGSQGDELLQGVMQRLEDAAAALLEETAAEA